MLKGMDQIPWGERFSIRMAGGSDEAILSRETSGQKGSI
jgi:hypothetical protein